MLHSTVKLLQNPVWNGIEVHTDDWIYEGEYQYIIIRKTAAVSGNLHKIEFPQYQAPLDGLSGLYRSTYEQSV